MRYSEARAALPTDAEWSSSFGNPGDGRGGFREYWKTANGDRYVIGNGSFLDSGDEFDVAGPIDKFGNVINGEG